MAAKQHTVDGFYPVVSLTPLAQHRMGQHFMVKEMAVGQAAPKPKSPDSG